MKSKIDAAGTGSHSFLIDNFFAIYSNQNGLKYAARSVKNTIKDLKKFRIQSDYHDVEITYDLSNDALSKSKEVLRKLKTF